MDARVFAALALMEDRNLIRDLQRYPGDLTRSVAFFGLVEKELLPSLWQGGQAILSGELVLLIHEKYKLDLHPICPHYRVDTVTDRQYCSCLGADLATICVAPHIYPCRLRQGWSNRYRPIPLSLSWSGESFVLAEICTYCRQLCDLAEEVFGGALVPPI